VKEPYVAIVGVCASGKSTLAQGLNQLGIKAFSVPQEHSFVRRLWEKLHPQANILIMLDARWETTKRRRPTISYGPDRLEEQRERLKYARELCDLYLPTDDLTIEEVRERVLSWIEAWKERSS
jgi:deoxyadenosine/deoxycytidine kinase